MTNSNNEMVAKRQSVSSHDSFVTVTNGSITKITNNVLTMHKLSFAQMPDGEFYLFKGISTTSSGPASEVTEVTPTTTSAMTVYVYYEEVSHNILRYDSEEKYFYFEDGEYPQTYVGDELNEILTNNITAGTTVLYTLTYTTQEGDKEVPVYEYEGQKYAKVTKGNNTAWFKVEPIRWRVSEYGVEPTATPMGFDGAGVKKENFTVVSDKIL